jgi:hypothetical protein
MPPAPVTVASVLGNLMACTPSWRARYGRAKVAGSTRDAYAVERSMPSGPKTFAAMSSRHDSPVATWMASPARA